jgi:hypothetical protein
LEKTSDLNKCFRNSIVKMPKAREKADLINAEGSVN